MLEGRGPVAEATTWLLWLEEAGSNVYGSYKKLIELPEFRHVCQLNRNRVSWQNTTDILRLVADYSSELKIMHKRILQRLTVKGKEPRLVMDVTRSLELPSQDINALSKMSTELMTMADELYEKQMEPRYPNYPHSVLLESKKAIGKIIFRLNMLLNDKDNILDKDTIAKVELALDTARQFTQEMTMCPLYLLAQFFEPTQKGKMSGDNIVQAKGEALKVLHNYRGTRPSDSAFKKDLNMYYDKESKDVGGLDFWVKKGCFTYPNIAAMAIDVLSLPSMASNPHPLYPRPRTGSLPAPSVAERGPPPPLASTPAPKRRAGSVAGDSSDDDEDLDHPLQPNNKKVKFRIPDQTSSRPDGRKTGLRNVGDSQADMGTQNRGDGVGSDVSTEDEAENGANTADKVNIIDAMMIDEAPGDSQIERGAGPDANDAT